MIFDLHAHAFPDVVAAKAIPHLEAQAPGQVRACGDGRLATLLAQMDAAGIDGAMICSIATKPGQFQPILEWSRAIREGGFGADAARRIVPLASVHPLDPELVAHLQAIGRAGLAGIKLHPYYQDFVLDAPPILDLLRAARDAGLLVFIHAGFDIAFPRERRCDPARVARALEAVPGLRLVAAHLGGWEDWDEVERCLIGTPVDLETSYAQGYLAPARMRAMLLRHPADRLYFGTDWPWHSHAAALPFIHGLDLGAAREAAMLGGNAARLLDLPVAG